MTGWSLYCHPVARQSSCLRLSTLASAEVMPDCRDCTEFCAFSTSVAVAIPAACCLCFMARDCSASARLCRMVSRDFLARL